MQSNVNITNKINYKYAILVMCFCKIFGWIPYFHPNKNCQKSKFKKYIYLFMSFTILTTISIIAYYGRTLNNKRFITTSRYLGIISALSSILMNSYCILSIHFWKYKNYEKYLNLFEKFDYLIHKYVYEDRKIYKKHLFEVICFKSIIPLTLAIIQIWYNTHIAWWFALEVSIRHISVFKAVYLRYELEQIAYRYGILELIISNNFHKNFNKNRINTGIKELLDDVIKCLIILNDIIDEFNDLYGWHLLLLMLGVSSATLYYINNALIYFKFVSLEWSLLLLFWICFMQVRMMKNKI